MAAPRTSACAPWIDGGLLQKQTWVADAVAVALTAPARPSNQVQQTQESVDIICANAVEMATEVLYRMSGRMFTGECGPVTVRPVARPVDADNRGLVTRGTSYGGLGSSSMMTMGAPPVVGHYGENTPPTIVLNDFPVRTIVQVKIDGVVIPPTEYQLREFQKLVRLRTSASATPTERWGWPTAQVQDLPDTENGTFSVTYTYGSDPGSGGRMACLKLAEALALPQLGDTTRYPTRMTSFTRQGVTAQVASVIDVLKQGGTGIYEVDLWLSAVNPNKGRRQAVIFSPDRGVNRRTS